MEKYGVSSGSNVGDDKTKKNVSQRYNEEDRWIVEEKMYGARSFAKYSTYMYREISKACLESWRLRIGRGRNSTGRVTPKCLVN